MEVIIVGGNSSIAFARLFHILFGEQKGLRTIMQEEKKREQVVRLTGQKQLTRAQIEVTKPSFCLSYFKCSHEAIGTTQPDTIQSVCLYSTLNPKKNLEQHRGMINHFIKSVCHF